MVQGISSRWGKTWDRTWHLAKKNMVQSIPPNKWCNGSSPLVTDIVLLDFPFRASTQGFKMRLLWEDFRTLIKRVLFSSPTNVRHHNPPTFGAQSPRWHSFLSPMWDCHQNSHPFGASILIDTLPCVYLLRKLWEGWHIVWCLDSGKRKKEGKRKRKIKNKTQSLENPRVFQRRPSFADPTRNDNRTPLNLQPTTPRTPQITCKQIKERKYERERDFE